MAQDHNPNHPKDDNEEYGVLQDKVPGKGRASSRPQ